MTFLVFLVISSGLWIVQTLNDDAQRDLRLAVNLVNVPDSVTRISPVPPYINVNVRSRGTTLLRYLFDPHPEINIDYRSYISGDRLMMSEAALKAFFRNKIGATSQIISVNPDSLVIYFTDDKGVRVPVKVDAHVEPGPQYAIIGKVRSLTDTVTIYSLDRSADWIRSISTAPIVLNDVSSSQTIRVKLLTPPQVRAIPDSVNVRIEVEPLVSKKREVELRAVNVPDDIDLILSPRYVDVYYMVPMSIYKLNNSDPQFVVTADYASIKNDTTGRIAVNLQSMPRDFYDVLIDTDSVNYIIEKKYDETKQ